MLTIKFRFGKLALVSRKETLKTQNKGGVILDTNKLLYFIKDRGYRVEDFCREMDMSISTFYRRCNENTFRIKDVWNISKFLKLTQEDINSIFFANMVS